MQTPSPALWLLLSCHLQVSQCHLLRTEQPEQPAITEAARLPDQYGYKADIYKRTVTDLLACSYYYGDVDSFTSNGTKFNCYVYLSQSLWVFCPTTTASSSSSDCEFVGRCKDKGDCSSGCGKSYDGVVVTSCGGDEPYCSVDVVIYNTEQTWSWFHCGTSAETEVYGNYYTTTTDETTASEETSTSAAISILPTTVYIATTPAQTASSGAASETSQSKSSSGGSSTNTGAIVGGVIGGLVLVCGTAIAIIYMLRRNNNHEEKPKGSTESMASNGYLWRFSRNRSTRGASELEGGVPAVPPVPGELPGSLVGETTNKNQQGNVTPIELPG